MTHWKGRERLVTCETEEKEPAEAEDAETKEDKENIPEETSGHGQKGGSCSRQ